MGEQEDPLAGRGVGHRYSPPPRGSAATAGFAIAVTEDVSSDVVAVVHVDTEAPRAAQRALALARR